MGRRLSLLAKLLLGAVAVMGAALGALGSAWLVADVASVHDACDRTVPWFEGIVVDTAQRSWWPPIVRCTLVDRAGHASAASRWGWGDLATLAALDAVAVTGVTLAVRRLRHGDSVGARRAVP